MSNHHNIAVATLDESVQTAWFTHLVEATTPGQVGALIVELVEGSCRGVEAALFWPSGRSETFESTVDGVPEAWAPPLVQAALHAPDGTAQTGHMAAVCLLEHERVVLLLKLPDGASAQALLDALGTTLQLGVRRFYHAMKLLDLHDSHKQLERSEHLQRALFAISDLAGSALDMPQMLKGIHRVISTLMYAENFFIVRCDIARGALRFLYYADERDEQADETASEEVLDDLRGSATWHVLTKGRPLMGDYAQLVAQTDGELVTIGPSSTDWLGVPMVRDGQVHGALVVQTYGTGLTYSPDDRSLLEFVANHVLTALERKQNKDELEQRVLKRTSELAEANRGLQQEVVERQRAEQLQAVLFQLAQLATADIDEGEFYQRVHGVVGTLLNAENFFIALLSTDNSQLDFPYYVDAGERQVKTRVLGRGLSEYVLRSAQPLLMQASQVDALAAAGEISGHTGTRAESWLGVPLWVNDAVIGLVAVQSYEPGVTYDTADQELLAFAALQIANSIFRRRAALALHEANAQLEQRVEARTRELREQIAQREQIQQQLKHQILHDQLTGLPNRGRLRLRIDQLLELMQREPGRRCALLYLDVDRFKVVNDSLGHLAGDAVLKGVAQRLLSCVREPDMVARLSGDEFALLLDSVDSPVAAMQVATRVLEAVNMPLHIAGEDLLPAASIGVALGNANYQNADDLLRDADVALYRAKREGRNRVELFTAALARNVVDVLGMEADLRHALQHNEFEPFFQPLRRLADGKLVGVEALLRWHHPRRGLLLPYDFLKVAEDSGLIEAIDWRMFELSCRAMADYLVGDMFVTINVSALHLGRPGFSSRLLDLLAATGLANHQLIIEVTEGSLLGDPEQVRRVLQGLRDHGIGAALDDFGTGYSSLSYLHSLPLRLLKIDRAFVQAMGERDHQNSSTVVATIIALARALNMQVIAEGIETQDEQDALRAMGCELGQGYLLGSPLPLAQWQELRTCTVPDPADIQLLLHARGVHAG
ncbi:MAG TPA: EAL domain-containing protein [Rhodanobacter sp.]|nr:EAL domain-containing protein [Rhodanobacter sp.]